MRKIGFAIILILLLCAPALAGNIRMMVTPPVQEEHEPEMAQTLRPGDTVKIELSESVLVLGGPHDFYGLMYTGTDKYSLKFMTFNPNQGYTYMDKVPFSIQTQYDDTFRLFGCLFRVMDATSRSVTLIRMD